MRDGALRTWLNTELNEHDMELLKEFLDDNEIEYETSECYDLIHIEVNVNEYERQAVNEWMEENIY